MPRSLLDVVRVHDPLGDLLVRGEGAGLAQQLVDQRGLAMVDVGDDGDVADLAGVSAVVMRAHGRFDAGGRSARHCGAAAPHLGRAQQPRGISSPALTWPLPRKARGSGPYTRTAAAVGRSQARRRRPERKRPASSASRRDRRPGAEQHVGRQQARLALRVARAPRSASSVIAPSTCRAGRWRCGAAPSGGRRSRARSPMSSASVRM